jgi:hypothetical protein
MARPRSRQKLPVPTDEDIVNAVASGLEIVSLAPRIKDQLLFINMMSKNGQSILFCLDPIRADYMRRILRDALPADGGDGSPTTWAVDAAPQAYGFVPRSID